MCIHVCLLDKCLSKCQEFSLIDIEFSYKTARSPTGNKKTCSLHMKCPKGSHLRGTDTLYCDTESEQWVDGNGKIFSYSDRPNCIN